MASKVYFTDMRTRHEECLQEKLLKLIRKAGFDTIDFKDHYAAIKLHFGELGNLAFLRPNWAKTVVEERGRKGLLDRLQHSLCRFKKERHRPS